MPLHSAVRLGLTGNCSALFRGYAAALYFRNRIVLSTSDRGTASNSRFNASVRLSLTAVGGRHSGTEFPEPPSLLTHWDRIVDS